MLKDKTENNSLTNKHIIDFSLVAQKMKVTH